MRFRAASGATRISDASFEAALAPDWDILGVVDGGYLLAVAARALQEQTGRDPVAVTAHYLSPGRTGPASVGTAIVKTGARFTTGTAMLRQDGRDVLTLLGTFGTLHSDADVQLQDYQPPHLPPPDDLPRLRHRSGQPFPPPFVNRVDLRLSPEDAGFVSGKPSGVAQMRGYWRLLDGEPCDAIALLLAADSLPPTSFNSGLDVAWTPTLELTVHVRAVPTPGWLRVDTRTHCISHGRLEVDGLIWDSADQLVAMSRQLMLVPQG
jgi:acyl-CoA thioesterase